MSSRKSFNSGAKYNFNTFQVSSQPATMAEPIPTTKMQSRSIAKRFCFQDVEQNAETVCKSTPIQMINQGSDEMPRKRPQESQIIIVPVPELVEQDKSGVNLDIQTVDSLQRQSILFSTPLQDILLSSHPQILENINIPNRIRLFNAFFKSIEQWLSPKSSLKQTSYDKQEIKKWIQLAIKQAKMENRNISFRENSQILEYVLSGEEDLLIKNLTLQGKYSQAQIISNLWDGVSRDNLSRGFLLLKKEFNIINSCSLSILNLSCWLFEFILAADFFSSRPLLQCGDQIFKRYISHPENVFMPELILLGILCGQNFSQEDLLKMVKLLDQNFVETILLLKVVSNYKADYPNAFFQITKNIVKNIQEPKHLIQILEKTQLPQCKVKNLLQNYLKENVKATQSRHNYPYLKAYVLENSKSRNQQEYFKVLKKWTTLEEVRQLHSQGKDLAFIDKLTGQYKLLQGSQSQDFKELMRELTKSVTSFRLVCTYKKQKKKDYYQLLDKLDNIISAPKQLSQEQKEALEIIHGCKYFLELNLGIFNLYNPIKIQKISSLHTYLNSPKGPNKQTSKQFLHYLDDTLIRALQSREGNIFLVKLLGQASEKDRKQASTIINNYQTSINKGQATALLGLGMEQKEKRDLEKNQSTLLRIVRMIGKSRTLLEKIRKGCNSRY